VRNNASTEAAVCGHTIDQEIEMYLNSIETSTSSLLQYPNLVKAFLKYNDALLPSDAAVERLFSCARQILVPRWCKVSDEMFIQTCVFVLQTQADCFGTDMFDDVLLSLLSVLRFYFSIL